MLEDRARRAAARAAARRRASSARARARGYAPHLQRDRGGGCASLVGERNSGHGTLGLERLGLGLHRAQLLGDARVRGLALFQLLTEGRNGRIQPLAFGGLALAVHLHLGRAAGGLRGRECTVGRRMHDALLHAVRRVQTLRLALLELVRRRMEVGTHVRDDRCVHAIRYAGRFDAGEEAALEGLNERRRERRVARRQILDKRGRLRRELLRAARAAHRRRPVAAIPARARGNEAHALEEGVREGLLRVQTRLRVVAQQPRDQVDRVRRGAGREDAVPPVPSAGRWEGVFRPFEARARARTPGARGVATARAAARARKRLELW